MKVVVSIDMQKDFFAGKDSELVKRVTDSQRKIIRDEIKDNSQLLFVVYSGYGKISEELTKGLPERGILFKKNRNSVFTNKRFLVYLQRENVEEMVVMGQNTSACVYLSVCDALKEGYKVYVPENAVMDTNLTKHDLSMKLMEKRGACLY